MHLSLIAVPRTAVPRLRARKPPSAPQSLRWVCHLSGGSGSMAY
ncbi:MAG: hypothetical protein OXU61_03295 [Gammaproteobacteria bacterium]|nr:hypothetical protein [Gammaproteobacteria bacterium]